MIPTSIRARGFISHGDTLISYAGVRLATYAGPSGSGKSSIASDALEFALFGEARLKGDDLVTIGQTDMSVALEFELGPGRYRIVRGRTTKGGGKPFLELAIAAAPGWRPLSGATIRETQEAIERLLRVDHDTFRAAVLLGQGDLHRFAAAAPKERKRILGSVLGLDRWERAAERAREEAREVERVLTAEQSARDRLDEQLATRPMVERELEAAAEEVAQAVADIRLAHESRQVYEARRVELVGILVAGDAAQRDVDRINGTLRELLERHQRAQQGRLRAESARDAAMAALADAGVVEAAAGAVAGVRADAERWDARLNEDRRLESEIRGQEGRVRDLEARHGQERARWETTLATTKRRVDELSAGLRALPELRCPKCRHAWHEDVAGYTEKLRIAQSQLHGLERDEVREPTGIGLERAKVARLESKRRENGYDAAEHEQARRELVVTERIAARAEVMDQHRATIERAGSDFAAADAELADVATAGRLAREERDAAAATVAGLEAVQVERRSIEEQLANAERRLADLARVHAGATGRAATAAQILEEFDAAAAEREAVAGRMAELERDLSLLRRLAIAFGPAGIPARIMEGVLPELAGYAQELLTALRPDMTLELRATREKRDGKGVIEALDLVARDPAGERVFLAWSGGEKTALSLSMAVGLSRLVARRAGAALRCLVVDEPDGLDVEMRRAFGQALRVLAHQGALSLVVLITHHDDLAEIGDVQFRLSKNGHGSVVEQAA